MSYKLTITQKPTYLHAIVTGLNNKDNLTRYQIMRRTAICADTGCIRSRIEPKLKQRSVEN
jgi:hypothetical protein